MVHGKARLCTEILSAGTQCTQFALRGQPWCRSHAASSQRERNADARQLIAMIRQMNVVTVACVLQNTVYELRTKVIPPLHAQAIFDAAASRLEHLIEEHAQLTSTTAAHRGDKSHQNNGLQVVPIK
jgi:hypothetical protein